MLPRCSPSLVCELLPPSSSRCGPTAGGLIGATIPGFGDTRDGFRQLFTFSEDQVFSPNSSNTVRLGFNRIHLTFPPNDLLNPSDFDMTMPTGAPGLLGIAIL